MHPSALFLFFKTVLAILGLYNSWQILECAFVITYPHPHKLVDIFIGIALNLQINLGRTDVIAIKIFQFISMINPFNYLVFFNYSQQCFAVICLIAPVLKLVRHFLPRYFQDLLFELEFLSLFLQFHDDLSMCGFVFVVFCVGFITILELWFSVFHSFGKLKNYFVSTFF